MSSQPPDSPFRRFVEEKHDEVKSSYESLWYSLSFDKLEAKVDHAEDLAEKLDRLEQNLAAHDCPEWLTQVRNAAIAFARASGNPSIRKKLLNRLHKYRFSVASHKWEFEAPQDESIDFSNIAAEAKASSNIPKLFDSLIEQLEKLLMDDHIDSISARAAIERLLATLRAKESRTFFGMIATNRFARHFIRNWLIGTLKKIPVAGGVIEAFEQTAEELAVEDRLLMERVSSETQSLIQSEFERLPGQVLQLGVDESVRMIIADVDANLVDGGIAGGPGS